MLYVEKIKSYTANGPLISDANFQTLQPGILKK